VITERVTISTCGSDFNTSLAVFTGICGTFGSNPPYFNDNDGPDCDGLSASVNFSAAAGTTYYILVGGYGGAGGKLQITAIATPPPFNDNCTNAIP